MSRRLQGNGLWESSRIILPEFRERMLESDNNQQRKEKPILDGQETEQIEQALVISYNRRVPVELRVFDPFEDTRISGVVTVLNIGRRLIKLLRGEDDYQWIEIDTIVGAYIDS